MATVRIPLVGSFNQRGIDGSGALVSSTDQRFLNCSFDLVHNPITGKSTIYVAKRPGWGVDSVVSNGNASTALIKPQSFDTTLTAFGDTNSTIYWGPTNVGTITGRALHMTETIVSGVSYVMIKSSDGTGWYYADGAKDDLTYVGDTTNASAVISNLDSTTGIYVGQSWTGTGVGASARVLTVDSSTQITLNVNSTATASGITFTKEPIAKILDADFITTGTQQSAFAEMNGYLFYAVDTTGKLYNSDLNSVTAYTSTSFISPNMSPDPPIAVARHQDKIVVFGAGSREVFADNANVTGSPLQRIPQHFSNMGTLDQRGVSQLEDDIYFVASSHVGDIGVYQLRNLQATRISTPQVDRILGSASATSGAIYASTFRLGGYSYLYLYLTTASDGPASNLLLESADALLLENGDNILLEDTAASVSSFVRVLCYNIDLQLWSEWDCAEATFLDGSANGTANQIFATSRTVTDGKVYTIYPASQGNLYQDDGSSYTMEIRTSKIDLGTSKRKRIKSIRLIADYDPTGTCTLEWSDDDYATWSTPRAFDLTSKEPKLPACGSHKGYRAYRLKHTGNAAFRAEALEIEYESEANKIPKRE